MSEQRLNALQWLLRTDLLTDGCSRCCDTENIMESFTEVAATNSSARTYSQVVFTDIPQSYQPSTHITCSYTLTAAFQPNPRDWVGIFKVGWSTTKDYHTFVWVEPCLDVVEQSVTRQAVFKDYYLPKDEIEFYQFCYVDSTGQVRGASTPFCFRNPVEQNMESSTDDELLVITTQEQVEQSVREKAELQKELTQIMEENETLKRALQKEQQDAASLKDENEQKEKEKSQLLKELGQIKEQNENLKSTLQERQKETDHLKEEMTQTMKQMETRERKAAEEKISQSMSFDKAAKQTETHAQEKYDRAVMKINQLKEEREELRGKVDAQSQEICKLNSIIREKERELFKVNDNIQLLQVDVQSSEKANEKLSAELLRLQSLAHNMDDMKKQNQELCRRLSQQDTPLNSPDDDLREQCQTLTRKLQDTQAKLATEKEESKNIRSRVEYLDREVTQLREQLEGVISSLDQANRKCNKQELQLREAHEKIAERESDTEDKDHLIMLVKKEKEELMREHQNLTNDIEALRRAYADIQAAPPAESSYMQPDVTSPAGTTPAAQDWQQPESTEQAENLYETIGSVADQEEESLVCRHCQERFPLITQQELEQHEQSHRVCPFCTMICDNMEQSVFEDHVYSHEL
ncbi:calcium-binding and coiled-coil domain-containing protein 2 [Morone saxatilis]|uniref:calcium-binding and coiled-coil domain-containing protein 2 n=1 Tax=Morone saxatilis TaxID=34816 RepID=UPI0015E243B4|nr:calcium-binding and coiled-coil domain-containing protein 2 [Morone saxatilis]